MRLSSYNPIAAKRAMMAIADRGLLGAVTFLTSIILGRWGGPGELGLFAIFFSIVFLALAVQESFTIAPYNLLAAARGDGTARQRYLGGVLIDTLMLSAVLAALLLVAGTVLWLIGWSHSAAIAFTLVAAAPCIVVREFARRVVYADFRPQAAMVISAGVSVLQVTLMGCFYVFGRLDAATSFAAMGASSFVGAVAWFYADRATIEFSRHERADWYREHWQLGRWLLAGQASEIVRTNMLPWLLALGADEATVGIYAACSFVASLPTPLHVAISNMLVPQMAHLERRSGLADTDRLVRQATGWLTATMAVTWCLGSTATSSRTRSIRSSCWCSPGRSRVQLCLRRERCS
jgi:O-antigen/teichoic acid export membrane protein